MQFQTGFFEFSENVGMNFQLNRFYSMGVMDAFLRFKRSKGQ